MEKRVISGVNSQGTDVVSSFVFWGRKWAKEKGEGNVVGLVAGLPWAANLFLSSQAETGQSAMKSFF